MNSYGRLTTGLQMATRPIFRCAPLLSASTYSQAPRTISRTFSSAPALSAAAPSAQAKKLAKDKARKKRKKHVNFKQYDLKDMEQFTLCDAMRYIRAFEVGRPLDVPKYDCHVKLKTKRDGPIIRNTIQLPHSVKTDIKVAVICPPNSPAAKQAREAGAVLVGEDEVFEVVKSGKFDIDRCVAHPDSLPKINAAGLPRILGPRGLMPSAKLGTVVTNVGDVVRGLLGGSMYKERTGVVRMAIGQLGFSPEMLRDNLKAYVGQIKKDAAVLNDQIVKEVYEVVLSSTNSPGFSLNGKFRSDNSPPTTALTGH